MLLSHVQTWTILFLEAGREEARLRVAMETDAGCNGGVGQNQQLGVKHFLRFFSFTALGIYGLCRVALVSAVYTRVESIARCQL